MQHRLSIQNSCNTVYRRNVGCFRYIIVCTIYQGNNKDDDDEDNNNNNDDDDNNNNNSGVRLSFAGTTYRSTPDMTVHYTARRWQNSNYSKHNGFRKGPNRPGNR